MGLPQRPDPAWGHPAAGRTAGTTLGRKHEAGLAGDRLKTDPKPRQCLGAGIQKPIRIAADRQHARCGSLIAELYFLLRLARSDLNTFQQGKDAGVQVLRDSVRVGVDEFVGFHGRARSTSE